jgi:hypothetical protein
MSCFISVSNLYRQTFNISLGIIELNVVNDTCATSSSGALPWNVECSNTITLNERLSLFSQWRGSSGTPDAGLYHLATACATDTEIGVAWLGTICQTGSNQQSSGFVSGTGVSVATRSEWSLISHEMVSRSGTDSPVPRMVFYGVNTWCHCRVTILARSTIAQARARSRAHVVPSRRVHVTRVSDTS